MQTNPVDQFTKQMMAANQQVMDSTLRLNQLAMEAEGEMLRHRISSLDLLLKPETMDGWNDIKTPADFFAKSTEMSTAYNQSMSDWMQKTMELQADLAKRMTDAYQEEMTKATEAMMGKVEDEAKPRARAKAPAK